MDDSAGVDADCAEFMTEATLGLLGFFKKFQSVGALLDTVFCESCHSFLCCRRWSESVAIGTVECVDGLLGEHTVEIAVGGVVSFYEHFGKVRSVGERSFIGLK